MKKITYILSLTALVAMVAVGCSQKPKDLLTQKWTFKDMDQKDIDAMVNKMMGSTQMMLDTMKNAEEKAKTESMMKEQTTKMTESMKEGMKGLKMEFKADGTFEVTSPGMGGKTEKGKWELSEDGKKLTQTDEGGKKTEMELTKLTKEEMTMHMNEGGMEMHITMQTSK